MKPLRNVLKAVLYAATLLSALNSARATERAVTEQKILVPVRAIYPGDTIGRELLVEQPRVASRSDVRTAGYVLRIEDAEGRIARRTLLPGQPIPLGALRKQMLVLQGRTYNLMFKSKYIAISSSGIALQPGASGDVINVKNADTGVVVRARVEDGQTLVVETQ